MAQFGACHPVFKPNGVANGVVLGKLVSANMTVQLSTGELFADDVLDEKVSEFASGTIAEQTNDLEDSVLSILYGCKVVDGAVVDNVADEPPRGMHGYYKTLMRNGVKYYQSIIYPQAAAVLGNDNAQTKGSNITFTPTSTTFNIFADENGNWRERKIHKTAAEAIAYLDQQLGVKQYHKVEITVQGAGPGKSVDKVGAVYVPAGENLVLKIKGTPAVLYDNAVEKKASISGGSYTISNVKEDHSIVVVFAA